ncbi:MAG: S8 family serine peptidase [Planctomycetes bacterium]|nr:S8 family serine peptidase [Planctomycetota bacterium]
MRTLTIPLVAIGLCLLGPGSVRAQSRPLPDDEPLKIRAGKARLLTEKALDAKTAAWASARRHGWSPRTQQGVVVSELMAIRGGRVYVCQTANSNAGITAAANLVRNTSPYNLNGLGVIVGVWDGGAVLTTHQELTGRVSIQDGSSLLDHATHVAGTVGATGVVASAIGMAPSVSVDSYDWTGDLGEMTVRAMAVPGQSGTIQLSNHSYVYAAGWDNSSGGFRWHGTWGERESRDFGQYDELAQQWDELCYDAPYYLPVKAAGNERDDPVPAAGGTFEYWLDDQWNQKSYDPDTGPFPDNWDAGGYDTLATPSTAKNVMVVGAVSDAVYGGQRQLALATMTPFTSWGPTDDGRIKPDLVTSGMTLYSCTAIGDASYASYSGTSMATAVVSGSAALLVEYYGRLFPGQHMRSDMLRGLMIHTADDLEAAGPDYQTGWGLLNVEAAAEQLLLHQRAPATQRVVSGLLNPTQPSASYSCVSDGTRTLKVTLCWTDPPGPAQTGLDNTSPCLVNDLDLRVVAPDGVTVHMPYILDPASPASPAVTGDNARDNVEQTLVSSPVAGSYTVAVSHKGSLTDGQQHYALLVSGVSAVITGDYDRDEDVDAFDLAEWATCASAPGVTAATGCDDKDLDADGDVDQADFAVLQRCYSGMNGVPPPDCFE